MVRPKRDGQNWGGGQVVLQYLAYTAPLVVFWLALIVLTYASIALGFALRRPLGVVPGEPYPKALDVAQGMIVTLAALILAFAFSFASTRFEGRRLLIVQESNNIGTTYLRASYLPAGSADRFRAILRDYTRARIATFTRNSAASSAMERKSAALQGALWSIAAAAARADPRNVELGLLTQTLNETIDVSAAQSAALHARMPAAVLRLVLIVTLASTTLLGVGLTGPRRPRFLVALMLGLLVATVVSAIVDIDYPLSGRVRIDLAPLQRQLQSMQ
jgi:hypothetical protein